MKGGQNDPSLIDRARPGSKHHLVTEAHGIPLAVSLTDGNRHGVTQLDPLIEAIPPVRGRRGGRASARKGSAPTAGMTMTSTASRYARRASRP